MHKNSTAFIARAGLAASVAFVLLGCASGGGAGWTYAPLGPTQSPGAGTTGAPSSPGGSPGALLEVSTEQASPLAFTPNTLTAPANTTVTVNYNNNSNILHNIKFFSGADSSAPVLGATENVTGPNALRSVTFTTPSTPGNYYFWCDVHGAAMAGTLQAQ